MFCSVNVGHSLHQSLPQSLNIYSLSLVSPRNLVNVTSTTILTNQSDDEMFTCVSGGGPENTFQWYLNGELLSNETSPVINITMVTASDAGEYNCTVTNAAGGGSDVATLIGECVRTCLMREQTGSCTRLNGT